MDITRLELSFEQPNVSLQIGDKVYVSNIFQGNILSSENTYAGVVVDMGAGYIQIKGPTGIVTSGMFLSFSKDNTVNESSLKGYYASTSFENHSNKYTELFSIGSEVVPSSK